MALSKDQYANYGVGDAADFNERPANAWADDQTWEIDGKQVSEKEMREAIEKFERDGTPIPW